MSWNDGITKMMSEYLDEAARAGDLAIEVFKTTIDDATRNYSQEVSSSVRAKHFDTGDLADSFTVEEITDRGSHYYGYRAYFKGENTQGVPREKIANTLNFGRAAGKTNNGIMYGAIAGSHFISKAIKKLKGLDEKIENNIHQQMADLLEAAWRK